LSLAASGDVLRAEGDLPTALARYREAMDLARNAGETTSLFWLLRSIAAALADWGRWEDAARLFGAAGALQEADGSAFSNLEFPSREPELIASREHLGEVAFRSTWDQARALPVDDAIAEAFRITDALLAWPDAEGNSGGARA
jgi:hypothetical protein